MISIAVRKVGIASRVWRGVQLKLGPPLFQPLSIPFIHWEASIDQVILDGRSMAYPIASSIRIPEENHGAHGTHAHSLLRSIPDRAQGQRRVWYGGQRGVKFWRTPCIVRQSDARSKERNTRQVMLDRLQSPVLGRGLIAERKPKLEC